MRFVSPDLSLRIRASPHAGKALAVLVVCALALTTWGAVANYQQRQQHYRHQAERELQTINHLHTRSVQQWREQRLADAKALTDDPLFEQAVVHWSQKADAAQQVLLLARLRILQEHSHYTAVYLVSAQGKLLLSPGSPTDKSLPAPEWQALQEALRSAQAQMVEPRQDTLFAFPFVSVLAPVFDGIEPLGAVWLVSDVRTSLYPLLAHLPTRSETAESNLVSRSGDTALYLNPPRHRSAAEQTLRVPMSRTKDPGAQAMAGARGVFYGEDYRGEQVMASASAVPASPWHVVTSIDTTEVFAETQEREMLALGLPISLGLLCAGLVFAALQRRGWQRERDLKAEVQRNMRWLESAQKAAALGYFAYELAPATFTLSSMARDIFGLSASNVPLHQWVGLIHPEQRKEVLEQHERALALRAPLLLQYCICRASDQAPRWLQVWGEYETQTQGMDVVRVIGTVQDITERKAAEQVLADYRTTLEATMRLDPLTQIANRRALDEHVGLHWQRAMRSHSALSLLMIDVDHFKNYNDHYGHVEGDACLQRVAGALAGVVGRRADDLVARYGGEEFAIVLPDTDALQACALAQKVCAAVRDLALPHPHSNTASCVTVSVGVACVYPVFSASAGLHGAQTGHTPGEALGATLAQGLFEQADAALYLAKQRGRNCAMLQPQPPALHQL